VYSQAWTILGLHPLALLTDLLNAYIFMTVNVSVPPVLFQSIM